MSVPLTSEQIKSSRKLYFAVNDEDFNGDANALGYVQVIRILHDTIADLQSQLAASEEKRSNLLSCLQQAEDALKEEQEENREERAKRGELLERAAKKCVELSQKAIYGCNPSCHAADAANIREMDPSASQAFDAAKNSGPVLDETPAESGRPVDLSSTADRGALARIDAMQQREQKLREALEYAKNIIEFQNPYREDGEGSFVAVKMAEAALAESAKETTK